MKAHHISLLNGQHHHNVNAVNNVLLAFHARSIYSTSSYIARAISRLPKKALDRRSATEKRNHRSSGHRDG